MASPPPPRRLLNRPIASLLVLGVAVLILVLILAAAYHGSASSSRAECGATHGLVARIVKDAAGLHAGTPITPGQTAALSKDDDDVNNYLNGAQSPDPDFSGRLLRVADALGRVVTDGRGVSPQTPADLAALNTAITATTGFCA